MEKIRALNVPKEVEVGEMKKRMKRYLCVARHVRLGEKLRVVGRQAEDGSAVAAEELTSEWLGDDVAKVVRSWVLLQVDGVDLLSAA